MKLSSGSSPFFCILAAVFSDAFNAGACDRAIDLLRREKNKRGSYEFHFSKRPNSMRAAFFHCVSKEKFLYHAAPKFRDAQTFYEFALSIVCENASGIMTDAKVVIDRNGNREFLQRLQCTLKSRLNQNGERAILKVKMEDSKSNNLVQLADMACGAVARSTTVGDNGFRETLKTSGHEGRVQFWPK